MLAALTAVMEGRKVLGEDQISALGQWHDALRKAWLSQKTIGGTRLSANNAQFSYALITDNHETLDPDQLVDVLRQVNREATDRVNTGWSLFFPFDRQPINPYFTSDPNVRNLGDEFLEANLTTERDGLGARDTDMWRVSPEGLASIIRPIRLDYLNHEKWSDRFFSINEAARHVGEIVRHAQGLAQHFDSATEVAFLCEWRGLADRTLGDPNHDWNPRLARVATKATRGTWPLGDVVSDWPKVVAELIAPLARAFGTDLKLGRGWVEAESKDWRPLGSNWP